jgi:hypothetical protein
MEQNLLLEGIFGGGGQSTSPSQQPSSGQSSGSTPTSGEATTNPPADDSQADPIYDEKPGETDDGTYTDVPPASSEETAPVTEEPSAPEPEETENEAGAPINGETGTDETVENETPAETGAEAGTQPQLADQPAAPVASTPSEPAAAPIATTPAPVATAPVVDDAVVPAEEETEDLKDFLTPFLADLEEIRQRQASGTSDARAESRNRAVAAIQDQLASRLLDSLSSETKTTTTKSASLLDGSGKAAEKPISLANRWYAEA